MSFKSSQDFIRIKYQAQVVQAIRRFFDQENFQELLPPLAVQNPGMEPHIHPYQLYSKASDRLAPLFLNTSPEFWMKKILSQEPSLSQIYTINYAFRDEPQSPYHRPQFLMLEWYRKGAYYLDLIQDIQKLMKDLSKQFAYDLPALQILTMKEIFSEFNMPLEQILSLSEIKTYIKKQYTHLMPTDPSELLWEDYFFLLFLNVIEPHLKNYPFLIIKEFPVQLKALATIKADDNNFCERFELYIEGIEIANAYNELTDLEQQIQRFDQQAILKNKLYHYSLPRPDEFYQALRNGLPSSAGIALGVDRLAQILSKNQYQFYY